MSSFLEEEDLPLYALLGRLLSQQHLLSEIMHVESETRRLQKRKRGRNTLHNRQHGLDWMDGLKHKEFRKGNPPQALP
jgi:hypothetical protein